MDTDQILNTFKNLSNLNDLVCLMNEVNLSLYPTSNPITIKNIGYYINREKLEKQGKVFYTTFSIPKKNGKERIISSPVTALKHYQQILNEIFKVVYKPHPNAFGFVNERSVVDNAKIHTNKKYVYNIDLKDFFPSFTKKWIYNFFLHEFDFKSSKERRNVALAISTLVCFTDEKQSKQVLPQGAPTSPIISNMLCYKLDRRLNGLAKRFGLNYSRYADDITFSSQHNIYKKREIFSINSLFDIELRRIINEFQLHINETKVRLQVKGNRQEVTGVIVNQKCNVSRKYLKEIRQLLYVWEKYGYVTANELHKNNYKKDVDNIPELKDVLYGKIQYLKMVKGDSDTTYNMFNNSFRRLYQKSNTKVVDINQLIQSMLSIGVNQALNAFDNGKN